MEATTLLAGAAKPVAGLFGAVWLWRDTADYAHSDQRLEHVVLIPKIGHSRALPRDLENAVNCLQPIWMVAEAFATVLAECS